MSASRFPLLEPDSTTIGLNIGSIWREKIIIPYTLVSPFLRPVYLRIFAQEGHNGFEDWSFVLIDQGFNDVQLRKKECLWQYKLNVFEPEGLNVRDVQIILD